MIKAIVILIQFLLILFEGMLLYQSNDANKKYAEINKNHQREITELKEECSKINKANTSLEIICGKLLAMMEKSERLPILTRNPEVQDEPEYGKNYFYVVIGSFEKEEDAQRKLQEAKKRGLFDARVSLTWNRNICYAILVGRYTTRHDATVRKSRIIQDFPCMYSDAYVEDFRDVSLTPDELNEKIQSIRIGENWVPLTN